MACKQSPCVSFDWELEDYPPASPGTAGAPAITIGRNSDGGEGGFVDGVFGNDGEAAREAVKKEMREAQAAECPQGCECRRQEGVQGTDKRFVVRVFTRYWNTTMNKNRRVHATARIKKTEYPGECFKDPSYALAVREEFFALASLDLTTARRPPA